MSVLPKFAYNNKRDRSYHADVSKAIFHLKLSINLMLDSIFIHSQTPYNIVHLCLFLTIDMIFVSHKVC